jgi:hypothetical protein
MLELSKALYLEKKMGKRLGRSKILQRCLQEKKDLTFTDLVQRNCFLSGAFKSLDICTSFDQMFLTHSAIHSLTP